MGGKATLLFVLSTFVATEFGRIISSLYLSWWSAGNTGIIGVHPVGYYIGIYGALSTLQCVTNLLKQFSLAKYGNVASGSLHDDMWRALLRAPMLFFNSTPLGRIVNRFSKDMGDIDRQLMNMTSTFISGLTQLSGALLMIGIGTYYVLAVFVPILLVFFFVQRMFQATAIEVKRMDSTTRSPVYAHFSQCLNGISTIRAFGANGRMEAQSAGYLNDNMRMQYLSMSANRWLSVRLELLGGFMTLLSAVFAVAMRNVLAPEAAALSLSYALQITSLLNMTVRLASLAENSFNAVERVTEYAAVAPEAAARLPPPRDRAQRQLLLGGDGDGGQGGARSVEESDWPAHGRIEYRNVSATYRSDLAPVLRGLSFVVEARQKVGVVGRTGAGKSSLFLSLYRIIEPIAGQILIDGVDTQNLGVLQLRSRLSIIPQEPVLFSGTVRYNVDPFSEHDDAALWSALGRAHLKDFIAQSDGMLDMAVQEDGGNFSVGQRQLLCMARALLRGSRVLVLDEATAAVDVDTDALIQATVRQAFATCTTLTIAHRLNTIIDSDMVLFLEAGQALEYAPPATLLAEPGSHFGQLVDATGPASAAYLRRAASGEVDLGEGLARKAKAAEASLRQRTSSAAGSPPGSPPRPALAGQHAMPSSMAAAMMATMTPVERHGRRRRAAEAKLGGRAIASLDARGTIAGTGLEYFEEVRLALLAVDRAVQDLSQADGGHADGHADRHADGHASEGGNGAAGSRAGGALAAAGTTRQAWAESLYWMLRVLADGLVGTYGLQDADDEASAMLVEGQMEGQAEARAESSAQADLLWHLGRTAH
jgi:ABC-type multidrug transport system fused ATPase/permease subunit